MAHGWDSYYDNASLDPSTLRKTSESEGSFSQQIANLIEHHDFNSTVASCDATATTSTFDGNCYPNPGVGNSSSDCVYQRGYTESQWQGDGQHLDYLSQCENGDMSDFTTDGFMPSDCFPTSFATDLQGIKQDCGTLTTSFLEDYSDVGSCLETDAGEALPSFKFLTNNTVKKPKVDGTRKSNLTQWMFSHNENAVFPTESLSINLAHIDVDLHNASNVKSAFECLPGEMKKAGKNLRSSTEPELSSSPCNMLKTTDNDTMEGCQRRANEKQKPEKDMERDLAQSKPSDIVSDHKNLNEGQNDPGSIEEALPTFSNLMPTSPNEQNKSKEEVRQETEDPFNQEKRVSDNCFTTGVQDRTMTNYHQDKTKVLQGEENELGPVENNTFDDQEFSTIDQDEAMETEKMDIHSVASNLNSFNTNITPHPESTEQTNSTFPNIDCKDSAASKESISTSVSEEHHKTNSGGLLVITDSISIDNSGKNKHSISNDPELVIQKDKQSLDTQHCVESCLELSKSEICSSLENEMKGPPERQTASPMTANSTNIFLDQNLGDLNPVQPDSDETENAKESFELLDPFREEHGLVDMLYGEPLSGEDSACEMDETSSNSSKYKETSEAKNNRSNNVNSKKGQVPQLKTSRQIPIQFQPIVILSALESLNEMSNSYRCANCKHTTNRLDNLIEHQHYHLVHDFTFCKTCDVYLMRNREATKHVCGINKERPPCSNDSCQEKRRSHGRHKCNTCGLIFSKIVLYIRHMRTHTGKTPFRCNKCGVYFAQSCTLQRHKRGRCGRVNPSDATSEAVTTKLKTPPQKESSHNRQFPHLRKCYVRLVDISKTNICNLCGKSFLTKDKTKKHIYSVHKKRRWKDSPNDLAETKPSGEKMSNEKKETRAKYECPICPRLFKYSYNRARHLRDCVKDSIYGGKDKVAGKYRCPLCHTTFTLSSNRYRHIKAFCLRQCLNRLTKQKTKPRKKEEEKKNEDHKQIIQPKENEHKEQPLLAGEDPKTGKRYKCNLCPATFSFASGKYRHMKKHELYKVTGKMIQFKNSSCSTVSKPVNSSSIDDKEADKNICLELSCHFCGKYFDTSLSLKKHQRSHRGERPYRCLECRKGFKKRCHLIVHKLVHQRRIQCTVCRKILPTVGELIQHRTSHLKRGMLQCPDCDQQFQYPAFLLRHLPTHRKKKNKEPHHDKRSPIKQQQPIESNIKLSGHQLQCSLCKEVFDDAKVLRTHCLTHISKSSSHQCPFCKHNFKSRRYLLLHMVKHTGDKSFSCKNCGKQFFREMYLKLHSDKCLPAKIKIESNTKTKRPYHCSICPRRFCKKMRLKNHLHAHKVNSLNLCTSCGQYFGIQKFHYHQQNCFGTTDPIAGSNENFNKSPSQANHNDHKKPSSTSSMFNFKCSHCPQIFRYRSLLLRHMVTHTGLQPYPCMYCGHRFSSRAMCLQHEAFCDGVYKEGPSKANRDASTKQTSLGEKAQMPQAEDKTVYKCRFCTKTFLKSRSLRHHILTHNEVNPYRCKTCDNCFSRYDHLKVHQSHCKGKKTWLEVCIPKISLEDVGRGWQNRFGNEPAKKEETFDCKECQRSFQTRSNLSRHITMFHVRKLLKCIYCGTSFSQEKYFINHMKMNKCTQLLSEGKATPPQEPSPVENLTKVSESSVNKDKNTILQRLAPFFNKKYRHVCSYCPRAFRNSWQLSVHTRLHTGEKPYSCDFCGLRFIRKDYVQRHLPKCSKKHSQNQVLCDRCGGFFSKIDIKNHKKNCSKSLNSLNPEPCPSRESASQTEPKGFSCAYCSSRFLLFSQLQEHFLYAHKLETVAPPVTTASLQHHLSNMPNIKEEPLDESCDDRLDEDTAVTYRSKTAPSSPVTKTFSCPQCTMCYANKSSLIAHLRGHALKYPFTCKRCKKGFWNKALVRNHTRKCRSVHILNSISAKQLEIPLKAEIDFALNDSALRSKGESTSSGTTVLQSSFSCQNDLRDKSQENPEAALVQSHSSKEKKPVQYQCSECDESFTDGLLLISHLEDHGRQEQEKKRNTCPKCGRVCSSQGHLEKHMKIHGIIQINKKYPCPDCSKIANTMSDLEIHRTCHDLNRPNVCRFCNLRFWTRPALCNHYNEIHPDKIYFCRFCNKTYSVKKSLQRHYKKWHQKEQNDLRNTVHEKGSTEQISTVQVTTATDSDEDANNDSEDTNSDSAPYFPCHVCGKTFPTSEILEDHQRCHLGEKPHECEECGKCFFQPSQLQQHQRMHKSEFQCQMCGRGFVTLFALRKHKHSHGKNRPYRCSKCHISFTGPSLLAEHMSTHREENFPCDICDCVFHSKSSRAEHRKNHSQLHNLDQPSFFRTEQESPQHSESSLGFSKELKYRCGICNERFGDPEQLSEHGCIAAKERVYTCSHCDKHFLHASHLKKHRNTHHPSWASMEYSCNKCKNSFSSSEHFLNHLKDHADTSKGLELKIENNDEEPSHDFICPLCNQGFASAPELYSHFSMHMDQNYQCQICKMIFSSKNKLEEHEHLTEHHPTSYTEFQCKECSHSFSEIDALHKHDCSSQKCAILENDKIKQSAELPSASYLAAEEEDIDVTGEDLFNCLPCSMQFSSKSVFLEHQNKVHINEKQFSCELCGKTFALRRYLKEHEKRHRMKPTNQKSSQSSKNLLRCTQCNAKFKTKHNLSVHMRIHAEKDGRKFRCDMCYKSFSNWQLLKLHQESHVGEVVYECTECDKAFAFPHLLEEHQQSHAGSSQ